MYGFFFKVPLKDGSAVLIAFKVIAANGASLKYVAFSYSEVLVPGGTFAQPSLEATNAKYSLDVAHSINLVAASTFLEPPGIANDQAHNQFDPLQVTAHGA